MYVYWVGTKAFGPVHASSVEDIARKAGVEAARRGTGAIPSPWRVASRGGRVQNFSEWPKSTATRFATLARRAHDEGTRGPEGPIAPPRDMPDGSRIPARDASGRYLAWPIGGW